MKTTVMKRYIHPVCVSSKFNIFLMVLSKFSVKEGNINIFFPNSIPSKEEFTLFLLLIMNRGRIKKLIIVNNYH